MASIIFKTKLFSVDDRGTTRQALNFKKTVKRSDCDLKPHQHSYYNSNMFESMLNRAYRTVIGEHTEFAFLDNLPLGVTVNDSGFLAVVTVCLPESFKR